jgi:hypothetical protein
MGKMSKDAILGVIHFRGGGGRGNSLGDKTGGFLPKSWSRLLKKDWTICQNRSNDNQINGAYQFIRSIKVLASDQTGFRGFLHILSG